MKIEKIGEEITYMRKNIHTDFTLTNSKGEIKKIVFDSYNSDDGLGNYDQDEIITGEDGKEIENIDDFLIHFEGGQDGQDIDPEIVLDELRDKIGGTEKDEKLKYCLDKLLDIAEECMPTYHSSDTIAEVLDIYKKYFN